MRRDNLRRALIVSSNLETQSASEIAVGLAHIQATHCAVVKIYPSTSSSKPVTITTVITLKINVPFSEWVKSFDSDLAEERHAEFGIKPLYRGVSKEDPSKIVVIHQAPEGAAEAFIAKYAEWITSHGVDLTSAQPSEWVAS